MNEGFSADAPSVTRTVWAVGTLLRAIADSLSARFNPVTVRGEISGFSRAASGHCYFTLKDPAGQLRCAMFRRVADQLEAMPADGAMVEVLGKLDVYGPRGDLQLIVERMRLGGQGALFEEFLKLKARLQAQGLVDAARKRALPAHPRSIGVVTSLGAAALRDVVTALQRRVPHLPVTIYPASVQGLQAPQEIVAALDLAYRRHSLGECDVLMLVRGGGSLEDLWCFNDERVVQAIVRSPMPLVCGVGHETDFTLADFAADLRAPTPTAAAELCAPPQKQSLQELDALAQTLMQAIDGLLDLQAQRLDRVTQRLGRPSARLHDCRQALLSLEHRVTAAARLSTQGQGHRLVSLAANLQQAVGRHLQRSQHRLDHCSAALRHLDPQLVLERGYAYLTDTEGNAVTRAAQVTTGQRVRATLADGGLEVLVTGPVKPD